MSSEEVFTTTEISTDGLVWTVTITRPLRKNAVNGPCAVSLFDAFRALEEDPIARVAVLYGAGGTFCAGADLKALSSASETASRSNPHLQTDPGPEANPLTPVNEAAMRKNEDVGPMGVSRLQLTKPVIAAIEGFAVAGGLELACWCDLRVAAEDSVLGVFCRRWGVPLIDGGTVRLPRLIGLSHAMDLILTGRPVSAREAASMGLVNRVCASGKSLATAQKLAADIASFPQLCMRHDRLSAHEQHHLSVPAALMNEFEHGARSRESGEMLNGAKKFASGAGRHGSFAKL